MLQACVDVRNRVMCSLMKSSQYKSPANAYIVEKIETFDETKEKYDSQSKWGTSESKLLLHHRLCDTLCLCACVQLE